jgi:hypothetical protein
VLLCTLSTLAAHWVKHRQGLLERAEEALRSGTQENHLLANFSDDE